MPTYEYECQKSGKRFEKFQNITANPLKVCPVCGGPARRLLGTGAALIFKGGQASGRDYRRGTETSTRCGRDVPCCGRAVPCDSPPCKD